MKTNIKLNNIKLFGYHGIEEYEKKNGQLFEIDIDACIFYSSNDDSIYNSLDYKKLYSDIVYIFNKKRYNLIETLAMDIINYIKLNYKVNTLIVSIRKPDVSIEGELDSAEIRMIYNA